MDELGRLRELLIRHAGEGLTPTSLPGVSVLCSRTTTERVGDVTEPTPADDAVRWNEERYRTLFDLGPVAVRLHLQPPAQFVAGRQVDQRQIHGLITSRPE